MVCQLPTTSLVRKEGVHSSIEVKYLVGDVGMRLICVLGYIRGLHFQLGIARLFLLEYCCSDFMTGGRRNVEWSMAC